MYTSIPHHLPLHQMVGCPTFSACDGGICSFLSVYMEDICSTQVTYQCKQAIDDNMCFFLGGGR